MQPAGNNYTKAPMSMELSKAMLLFDPGLWAGNKNPTPSIHLTIARSLDQQTIINAGLDAASTSSATMLEVDADLKGC
ncbi:hypothetical protein ColTof4_09030 [Colletotrichum tofieldiae]|nr:hypothetical protein ColTof3_03764 [Colletotrichum tofieldiae]GKT76607.1 hypothetical protein ColTof4_09030 [Colletotrichum tofieldiae]GKT87658.1 hypothetical protein Ct61P_05508 [Colletotrichum tofieldiae]